MSRNSLLDYRLFGIFLLFLIFAPTTQLNAQENNRHVVQAGDTLFSISRRYGVALDALAQANNITNVDVIYVGQSLIIPGLSEASEPTETDLAASEPSYHIVQEGETLASIATRYGLTVDQITKVNNIADSDSVAPGETLIVFEAADTESSGAFANANGEIVHIYQPTDSLVALAQKYGTSWFAIVQKNAITDPNLLLPGQEIVIPLPGVSDLGIIEVSDSITPPYPESTRARGRQILVDISDSRIYAFEDGVVVYSALVSTGVARHPTVQGKFSVSSKYDAQVMSGVGYYLPDVPWVMYFYGGYSIHGTYWHNNFGQPMSHGCVNLRVDDAYWFYEFAPLGTSVIVQE